MRLEHLEYLVCPKNKRPLQLSGTPVVEGQRIRHGELLEPVSGARYPIVDFIPRFVPRENYADSFGLEWNAHSRTQYDETSGVALSRERFERETGWGRDLRGENVLEIGSGSGRFTRHALETGARVFSCDLSDAVTANYGSNGAQPNLLLVQAGLDELPFRCNFFDKAFCFGVLQHTPDPRKSFLTILDYVKPGGKLASDIYVKNLGRWLLQPKYWVRPFTRKMAPGALYKAVTRYVDLMWPIAKAVRKVPVIGPTLNWKLLIGDYSRQLPGVGDATLKQWAYLDTFDMLSPRYDQPATLKTFRQWHEDAGLLDVDVHCGYNGLEARATKAGYPVSTPPVAYGAAPKTIYRNRPI